MQMDPRSIRRRNFKLNEPNAGVGRAVLGPTGTQVATVVSSPTCRARIE